MCTVRPLVASQYSHADILNSIFLALKDGIRRKIISPNGAEPIIAIAARNDCRVARAILEMLLDAMKDASHEQLGQSPRGHR